MHAAGRDLAGVAAAGVHAGRAPVAAAGVRAQLLRRAARARRAPSQRPPAAAAVQLHGVRAQHPAVAQRLPEAARPALQPTRDLVIVTFVLAIGKITCIIGVFGE